MPSTRLNYLVVYKGLSQVYGSAKKEIALETPPPDGVSIEDKRVLFVTFHPDEDRLLVQKVPDEEVFNAELKYPKRQQKSVE